MTPMTTPDIKSTYLDRLPALARELAAERPEDADTAILRRLWDRLDTEATVPSGHRQFHDAFSITASTLTELIARLTGLEAHAYGTTREQVAQHDIAVLNAKDREYGSSWKRRGGGGAFYMLARKWDRIENQLRIAALPASDGAPAALLSLRELMEDQRNERDGICDDVADLRRYLLLVRAEQLVLNDAMPF